MKVLFVCAVFEILSVVYGAVFIHPADPDHQGHCYVEEIGQMNYGEQKSLENCVKAVCHNDGSIQQLSCGLIDAPCGLIPGDLTKPYPDCCYTAKPCQ